METLCRRLAAARSPAFDWPGAPRVRRPCPAVAALLAVQVLYKITTPLTTGAISNPVVISNLLIAAVHAATLMVLLRAGELRS